MISKLAYVHPDAKIGNNVTVEPFACIAGDVVIGDDCWVGPGAVIHDGARIGKGCKIHTAASVSCLPQDLKFAGEVTTAESGDYNDIREYVTISRGTASTGTTRIGNRAILSGMYAALVFSVYNILNYFKLLPEPLQWNIHIYMAGPVCNGVMLAVALAYSLFRPEPVTEQLRGLTVWTLASPGKAD